MLINVISDKDEITAFASILKEQVETELKADETANIYYLQLDYPENGKSRYRDFLYVTTAENQSYIKEFTMSSLYSYDDFDAKGKAALMESIGN
jgi:hypothetical protein